MDVPMGRRKVPRKWIALRKYLTMKGTSATVMF